MRKILIRCLILLLAAGAVASASAAREFPVKAKRGDMKAYQYPFMKIGDKTLRLSAGSRIFNEQNMIIMPASLQKQSAPVMVVIDMNGQLSEVWLLTPEEAKQRPVPKVVPAAGGTGGTQK